MNRSYLLYKNNKFLWNKIYFFIEFFFFFLFSFFLSIEISITSIIKIEWNRVKLYKIQYNYYFTTELKHLWFTRVKIYFIYIIYKKLKYHLYDIYLEEIVQKVKDKKLQWLRDDREIIDNFWRFVRIWKKRKRQQMKMKEFHT